MNNNTKTRENVQLTETLDAAALAAQEDAQIEREMAALASKFAETSEHVENNLVILQKAVCKYEELEDKRHRFFLKWLYSNAKYKKDFFYATMIKALLTQNRAFFAISRKSLVDAAAKDPDNMLKGDSLHMGQFHALLAKNGFIQLWDANRPKKIVGGLALTNPDIIKLLKIDKEVALEQFKELKRLTDTEWFPEELVFDECGELRIKSDEIRALIKERRTKGLEPRNNSEGRRDNNQELKSKEAKESEIPKRSAGRFAGFAAAATLKKLEDSNGKE